MLQSLPYPDVIARPNSSWSSLVAAVPSLCGEASEGCRAVSGCPGVSLALRFDHSEVGSWPGSEVSRRRRSPRSGSVPGVCSHTGWWKQAGCVSPVFQAGWDTDHPAWLVPKGACGISLEKGIPGPGSDERPWEAAGPAARP